MKRLARILALATGLLLFASTSAQAGGPLGVCLNQPLKYTPGTVTLNYDGGGNLGSRNKAQADAIVTNAVSLWTNVGTSNVTLNRGLDLLVDVTSANYLTYYNVIGDGLNPVIYDTDGAIIDTLLGVGAKNYVLGFAGSAYYPCQYAEGKAVLNGYLNVSDTTLSNVITHEIGHLIGLDHTQLSSAQGLATANYPVMYPILYRATASLHDDDIAAVSELYPDPSLATVYGQLSGTFIQADGTPIQGANIWAKENTTSKVYSVVSDYLMQGTGYFKLRLPAGTYTLHAEAIQTNFNGGSGVGPFSRCYPSTGTCVSPSFLPPLYVSGVPMAPVTLGGPSTPTQIVIVPGAPNIAVGPWQIAAAPLPCTYTLSTSGASSTASAGIGSVGVTTASACAWTVASNATWITVTSAATVTGSGGVSYSVTANPSTNSRAGTLTLAGGKTFTVTQAAATLATQTITFINPGPKILGTAPFVLSATGGASGNLVTFTSQTSSICTVSGSTVTLVATGTCTIAADQAGNASYAAAPQVLQSFAVTAAAFSIIDHYYQNILNRPADDGGKAFWQGEATRMSNLGASPSEAYIVMARAFFTSPEFLARGFNDDQFVQNLYLTFYNRSADQGGLDYWKNVVASGLPRDMVMYAFMFSPEFNSFMLQNVGYAYQRAEVGVVIDYYRGAFGRLPDDGGLRYWVNQFRTAQCSGNPTGNVYSTAISIAAAFFGSAEYWTNPPGNSKYSSDLYNAFMRRGADLNGFNYWVSQLSTGAQTYDAVRQSFIDSPEFAARVQAISGQACTGLMQ